MRFISMAVLVVGLVLAAATPAQASILLTPQRVVFEEGDRSAKVVINNISDKALVYRLEWAHKRMGEDGRYVTIDPETEEFQSADEMVRFSPRQVALAPGQSQTVRLVLRRKAGTPDGEYRSHLRLSAVPQTPSPSSENVDGIQMQLNLVLSFSIPVIVRVGNLDVAASFADTRLKTGEEGDLLLHVNLSRTGDASSYGRVRALWASGSGTPREIGILNNVAVFPELASRTVEFPLNERPREAGQLLVRYEGLEEYEGRIFAEKAFRVQ